LAKDRLATYSVGQPYQNPRLRKEQTMSAYVPAGLAVLADNQPHFLRMAHREKNGNGAPEGAPP
jgi:hypothetical protein